jgi:hypothetical protein
MNSNFVRIHKTLRAAPAIGRENHQAALGDW